MLSDDNYGLQKYQGLWGVLHNYCGKVWLLSLKMPVLMHTAGKVVRCVPCCWERIKNTREIRKSRILLSLLVTKVPNVGQLFDVTFKYHKYHILQQRASSIKYEDASSLLQTYVLIMGTHWRLLISLPWVFPHSCRSTEHQWGRE